MSYLDLSTGPLASEAAKLRAAKLPFSVATVVRTTGSTAARPGAKALLDADGGLIEGWLGGGCVRAALSKAAARAVRSGAPELISVSPQEQLEERGISAGETLDGVRFARNGCPSKGTVDIFVEPILPSPELVILGGSDVARHLKLLCTNFDWSVLSDAQGLAPLKPGQRRMIVVATQGRNDSQELRQALETDAEYRAFVGSRRKFAVLSEKLQSDGADPEVLAQVHAPAGLAIAAETPQEIALSIMAQLTQIRRSHAVAEETPDV